MMFTSVVPVYIAQRFFYEVSILKFEKKLSVNWFAFGALLLFLAAFRFVLDDGILIQFFPELTIRWINH
jgi:hypothetical protein